MNSNAAQGSSTTTSAIRTHSTSNYSGKSESRGADEKLSLSPLHPDDVLKALLKTDRQQH